MESVEKNGIRGCQITYPSLGLHAKLIYLIALNIILGILSAIFLWLHLL